MKKMTTGQIIIELPSDLSIYELDVFKPQTDKSSHNTGFNTIFFSTERIKKTKQNKTPAAALT